MNKICISCNKSKDILDFYFRKDSNTYRKNCKECYNLDRKNYLNNNHQSKLNKLEYNKNYNNENRDKINADRKSYYLNNKDHESKRNKAYYKTNVDKIKEYHSKYRESHKNDISIYGKKYREQNKSKIRLRKNSYSKNKKKIDISFRLRSIISSKISTVLKNNNGSKCEQSCLLKLSFSIKSLKLHLEFLFESWMTWSNYGSYNSKIWDDNDQSTWRWNIDHIIPQSDLPYTSMDDENFNKCWALSNLRPLSAKQNQHDGTTKVRHKG